MNLFEEKDYGLIAEAKKAIRLNYDQDRYYHTVGAAVRCKSGKVYIGVNLYSLHGACAEEVAIGAAITNGKTYNGTYEVMQKTPKGTDYEIIIDGVTGYATVAPTEYYDGSEIPTLPINIDGYSLYFIPNES